MKFLHTSDIHLGIKRYDCPQRTEDFYTALSDLFIKHAVQSKVDFVLLGGDVFDKKVIDSIVMDRAIQCLTILKDNKIPVIAIHGNHDCPNHATDFSWLKSLSKLGFLKLLESGNDKEIVLSPWSEETKTGSYIDIGKARIYGSDWVGSSIEDYIDRYFLALGKVHVEDKFNIMMLHTEIEGKLGKPVPGIDEKKLYKLKKYVDYLALGHIHKNFEIDNWAYNPGSLEACTVDEYANVRGAYLVSVRGKKAKPILVRDYKQREIIRLSYDITQLDAPEIFKDKFLEFVSSSLGTNCVSSPLVEITLKGQTSLKTFNLGLEKLRNKIKNDYKCLLVVIRNQSTPVGFDIEIGEKRDRRSIEKKAISELLRNDPIYKNKVDKASDIVLQVKSKSLDKEDPETIIKLIERLIDAN